MTITIQIDGIEQLNRKLTTLQRNNILRPPMVRGVARLHNHIALYPPQRPNSGYERTGTLGRRWVTKIEENGDGILGKIGNNTRYAPLVQSHRFQSNIHRGRWQTDRQVVERNRAVIIEDFRREIRRVIET